MTIRHARHSPMLVCAPALALFCVLFVVNRQPRGVHDGTLVSAALLDAVVVAGPVCAGVGAWIARAERKDGRAGSRDLATRPRPLDRFLELAAAAAIATAGTLVTLTACAVWLAAGAHSYGGFAWWPLVAAQLGSALFLLLGHAVGRLAPFAPTAPLLVLVAYAGLVTTSGGYGTWWAAVAPVTTADPSAFDAFDDGVFAAQTVWFVTALVLVGAVLALSWAPSRTTVAAVGAAALLALGGLAALVPTGGTWQADLPVSVDETCSGGAPEICVHPAYAGVLGALHQTFDPLTARLAGTPAHADRLEHLGRDGSTPAGGARAIHLDAADGATSATGAAQELLDGLIDQEACFSGTGLAARPWELLVDRWLLTGASDAPDEAAADAAAWFSDRTTVQRHAWFVAHYDAFVTCRLGADDFR